MTGPVRYTTAAEIETALALVKDRTSFIRDLLAGALGWPIDSGRPVEEIAYEWTEAELQASGLDARIVGGKAFQFVLPENPWGIFLLEFRSPDPVVSGRGMAGTLRSVLHGLVSKKRGSRDASLASFGREHLLFICTHDYKSYRFAYFRAPQAAMRTAPLASFGWSIDEPGAVRTVCEYNLSGLTWPKLTPQSLAEWIEAWSGAFDVERVTQRFYDDYALVFHSAEVAIGGSTRLSGEDLRLFTQSLFNRLMFLRFLERKGWLTIQGQQGKSYLAALHAAGPLDGESLYRSRLRPLFFDALARGLPADSAAYGSAPFLNGGLFEEARLDQLVADVPDSVFDEVIGRAGLFYRYNFTVEESTPLDIDVAVDPEMLGRVFEELVTARHGTGSYYTPRAVVSFMCRQALKRYLDDRSSAKPDPIARLVDHGIVDGLSEGDAQAIETSLDQLKAVDPACGSGAYLLGLLHELIAIRRALRNARLAPDDKYLYRLKLHVISESLYGVDIDPFATEIAKLRLWLSLAIESEQPVPLPNLDFKIATGDSLGVFSPLPEGMFDTALRDRAGRLVDLKEQYLVAHGDSRTNLRNAITAEQESIAADFRHLVGKDAIDWHIQFADVFTQRDGFDLVLANPPYVSALEFARRHAKAERERIRARFTSTKGAWDLYVPFFERGVQLLRPGGYLAYISPNKYLSASYAQALRGYLRETTTFLELVDLSRVPVFASASVYPVLTFLRKGAPEDRPVTCRQPGPMHRDGAADPGEFAVVKVPQTALDLLPEHLWGFLLSDRLGLLMRVMTHTRPMSKCATVRATTSAAEADAFTPLLHESDGKKGIRIVNTGTIDPHVSLWGIKRLSNKGDHFLRPVIDGSRISAVRRTLYGRPKVLVAKLAAKCEAFLDSKGEYGGLNLNCASEPAHDMSLEFLCGYMNSRVFMFLYDQFFGALRMSGGYYQFQAPQLRVMPVPQASDTDRRRLDRIVGTLAEARSAVDGPVADQIAESLDYEFGRLLGLNDDEIGRILTDDSVYDGGS